MPRRLVLLSLLSFGCALAEQPAITPPPTLPSKRPDIRGARLFLTGDFLYWMAEQEGLDYAFKAKGTDGSTPITDGRVKSITPDWGIGFRIGLGYRLPHDQWDLYLQGTRYFNTTEHRQEVHNHQFISIPFATIPGATDALKVDPAKWHLRFNCLDFEFGRSASFSRFFAVRPFVGLRAASIDQRFDVRYLLAMPLPDVGLAHLKIDTRNDYHGIGLRLGSDVEYYFISSLSVFGQGSGSLLYGHGVGDTRIEFEALQSHDDGTLLHAKQSQHLIRSNLEARLGLKWRTKLYRDRAAFTLMTTYDMAIWFDQNQLVNFLLISNTWQTERRDGDLTFQGVAISGRFDF